MRPVGLYSRPKATPQARQAVLAFGNDPARELGESDVSLLVAGPTQLGREGLSPTLAFQPDEPLYRFREQVLEGGAVAPTCELPCGRRTVSARLDAKP